MENIDAALCVLVVALGNIATVSGWMVRFPILRWVFAGLCLLFSALVFARLLGHPFVELKAPWPVAIIVMLLALVLLTTSMIRGKGAPSSAPGRS